MDLGSKWITLKHSFLIKCIERGVYSKFNYINASIKQLPEKW